MEGDNDYCPERGERYIDSFYCGSNAYLTPEVI